MNQELICLASASPRRRELLDQIGVRYIAHPVEIDESRAPREPAESYVVRLALEKARTAQARVAPGTRILAADTAVVVDDDVLGKPADRADGLAMLRRLSGRMHRVMTGVAILCGAHSDSRLSISEVRFRVLGDDECAAYWDTGEPRDKAGGYAIQGRAAAFVSRLAGSYSGVVGLPLFETSDLLRWADTMEAQDETTGTRSVDYPSRA